MKVMLFSLVLCLITLNACKDDEITNHYNSSSYVLNYYYEDENNTYYFFYDNDVIVYMKKCKGHGKWWKMIDKDDKNCSHGD